MNSIDLERIVRRHQRLEADPNLHLCASSTLTAHQDRSDLLDHIMILRQTLEDMLTVNDMLLPKGSNTTSDDHAHIVSTNHRARRLTLPLGEKE